MTKVEEARAEVDEDVYAFTRAIADKDGARVIAIAARNIQHSLAALEQAIREEEREGWEDVLHSQNDYQSRALRAERVRVLEEARRRIASRHRKEDVTIVITEMLSEARGASGMVTAEGGPVSAPERPCVPASGPSPSEQPKERSEPIYDWPGSNTFVPEHLRKDRSERCPMCPSCSCLQRECGPECNTADPWIPCLDKWHSKKEDS